MKLRIITALCGIPLLLAFAWFDTGWFPLLILLVAPIAALGVLEFYRLGVLSGARPLTVFGVVWSVLFVASAHFDARYEVDYLAPSLLASVVVLPLVWLVLFSRRALLLNWSWTVCGVLYMGWMLGHYVALRELDQGREWVILVAFSTFACDTGAFLVGRTWGRHLMAASVSPHKTWEGAVAGFVASPVAALVIYALLEVAGLALPMGYSEAAIVGCIIGVVAQLGDLFESMLKRRAGVKDAGSLLPGHGGILDRIDSLVFAGAVVYYYVIWVVE